MRAVDTDFVDVYVGLMLYEHGMISTVTVKHVSNEVNM